jgi:DnaJ-domain-containing protein 1
MAKDKKKWKSIKKLFSKTPEPESSPKPNQVYKVLETNEVFVIEPSDEETFSVDPVSKDVFIIDSDQSEQGETFTMNTPQENGVEFAPDSSYSFVIEPEKEYKILGLETDATDAEVKKRYRDLIKQNHPDKGGDPKEFMKIRKAYTKIMDARAGK